jgi:predicted transcriptional regulator
MWFVKTQVGEIAIDRIFPTSVYIIEAKLAKSGSKVAQEREWKYIGGDVPRWD